MPSLSFAGSICWLWVTPVRTYMLCLHKSLKFHHSSFNWIEDDLDFWIILLSFSYIEPVAFACLHVFCFYPVCIFQVSPPLNLTIVASQVCYNSFWAIMANGPAPFSEIGKRAKGKPEFEFIIYIHFYMSCPDNAWHIVEHIHSYLLL